MARPTLQRKNILIDFRALLAATGAPRRSIAETTSTTCRLAISWMLLPAQAFPISRRSSLAISPPDRFWDRRCWTKWLQQILHAIGYDPPLPLPLLAAGSRPSSFAVNTFCAATRAWCRVTRPNGPMVYLRSFEPAPPVRYKTMNTLRPFGVDFDLRTREVSRPNRQCRIEGSEVSRLHSWSALRAACRIDPRGGATFFSHR